MRVDTISVHSLVVQRVDHPEFFAVFLLGGCLLQGHWRGRRGGLGVDRRGDQVVHVQGAVGHHVTVAHDQGLLEAARSGEGASLVETAVSGHQQVAQTGSSRFGGSELDVFFELSSEVAHSTLGDREGNVHHVCLSSGNSIVHKGYGRPSRVVIRHSI